MGRALLQGERRYSQFLGDQLREHSVVKLAVDCIKIMLRFVKFWFTVTYNHGRTATLRAIWLRTSRALHSLTFLPSSHLYFTFVSPPALSSRGVDPEGLPPNILLKWPSISRVPLMITKCLYCLNCYKFGSWLSGKSLELLPLDIRFLGDKMYKIRFRYPSWGAYSAPSLMELAALPWLHLRGPTSKGRGRG